MHLESFVCFLNYYFNFLYLLLTMNVVDRGSRGGGGKEKGLKCVNTFLMYRLAVSAAVIVLLQGIRITPFVSP